MDNATTLATPSAVAIAAGSLVKPIDTFDFDNYHGPASLEDVGLVLEVGGPAQEGHGTLMLIAWAKSGIISDHVSEDHTGHPDDVLAEFGVVGMTEEETTAAIEMVAEGGGNDPADVAAEIEAVKARA